MPEISRFFGVIIRLYYDDHDPPHIHAEYQGHDAKVDFEGRVLKGSLKSPVRLRLVRKWIRQNRAELELNWKRARAEKPLARIKPLM